MNRHKDGILGLYIEKLEELSKGKIPTRFEDFAYIFRETIPLFPEQKQEEYRGILEDGLNQVSYLRAKQVVDALKDGEKKRLDTIHNFLIKIGNI